VFHKTDPNLRKTDYAPLFFRWKNPNDKDTFDKLLASVEDIKIYDTIESQLAELVKITHPSEKLTEEEIEMHIQKHIGPIPIAAYGVWVYYPWCREMVHLLDEEEFIKVRTNRNMFKVDPAQISLLRKKKIGIIGLSVGQSIALTLAMERSCGELHLADFDTIELSNMNRLKAGVQDLGINKAIFAARQIAQLDPFIKVRCFPSGITEDNMEAFFTEDGRLDILVEECDSIAVKIASRLMAKRLKIPVVMDTNDKGMLDVERFDIEPGRPLFHGRLATVEETDPYRMLKLLKNLSTEEKINYLAQIIGMENVSDSMKSSIGQLNRTIIGWPQLASAVTLGGAIVTDTCRKILLGQYHSSERVFIDLEQQIKD